MSRLFRHIYEELVFHISEHGFQEVNQRTGATIRVGAPTSFTLDLSDNKLPVCGIRKTFPKSAAAEVAWFLQGSQDVEFISKYAPLWNDFTEEPDAEHDKPYVAAAYGYRWRNHFGRDQIGDAIKALVANPSDRRIFISAWDPAADGLGVPGKNAPCPVGFTLSITDDELNSTLLIRSSDVFVGLPYDVMGHALLMRAIQCSLSFETGKPIRLGKMHVTLAHPHFYIVHKPMLHQALLSPHSDDTILMPNFTVDDIGLWPDSYVDEVAFRQSKMEHPVYHCRPEVVV